jgi:hypothetical protein
MTTCAPERGYTREQLDAELLRMQRGEVRTGMVDLLDFDLGVARTIGAVVRDNALWIITPKLVHAEEYPGVPVVFEVSDDLYREYKLPLFIIRRTGMSPALSRWHPCSVQYRVPAKDAVRVTVNGRTGWDKYEEMPQAVPFDLEYSIVVQARNRGGNKGGPISDAQAMLAYLYRYLQPYCAVYVRDSAGDALLRTYQGLVDSYTPTQQISDTLGRVIGFELALTVQGELDMNDPYTQRAVTAPPIVRTGRK